MNVERVTEFQTSKYIETIKDFLKKPGVEKLGEIGGVGFHRPYFEIFTTHLMKELA